MSTVQTSRLGIWSFVLSLLPFITTLLYVPYWHLIDVWLPLVSAPMGVISLRRIMLSQGQLQGKGWVIAGIILSVLSFLAFWGLIIAFKNKH